MKEAKVGGRKGVRRSVRVKFGLCGGRVRYGCVLEVGSGDGDGECGGRTGRLVFGRGGA